MLNGIKEAGRNKKLIKRMFSKVFY